MSLASYSQARWMTQDEYREYFRQAYLVGERATKVEGVETLSSVGYNTATEGYLKDGLCSP